jgi:hypothetical protein
MTKLDWLKAIAGCSLLAIVAGCGSENPDPLPNSMVVGTIRGGGGGGGGSSPSGETVAAVAGDGWGALKGTFVYQGAAPQPKFLATGGKDGQVCDVHPIPDESLVVDKESGGIANIVIYARKVSRVHDDAKKPPEEPPLFDQKECVFLSHVLPVLTDVPITIKNSDPVGHNTSISPPGDTSSNNLIPGGSQSQYTFSRAQNEPVPVSCTIHPWMKAYMIPRKDHYIAVTKKDGSFEISNLPAGETVEFQVWHERNSKLPAKPEWAQGRFTLTIPKDGVEDLGKIEVSPALF